MDLAGHALPSGSARLEPYQNWLLHDAFYSRPRPEPHPVAAFVLANRGIAISLADLFALFGSDINDGPLLAESSIELHRPLAEDVDYEVRRVIVPALQEVFVFFRAGAERDEKRARIKDAARRIAN